MKEIYNVKKIAYGLFALFQLANCSGNVYYWRHITHKIPDLSESYIRVKMPKQFYYGKITYINNTYHARLFLEDKNNRFKPSILINPNRGLNILEQWYGTGQFELVTGCVYKIPIPDGDNLFEFYIGIPKILPASLIKNILVPKGHSLILQFEVKETEISYVHLWDQAFTKPKDIVPIVEKKPKLEIIASVEPNPDPDEDKLCEIPKD
nr:hypothetical protein [Leptospira interrogans]